MSDTAPAALLVLFAVHGVFGMIQFARNAAASARLPQR